MNLEFLFLPGTVWISKCLKWIAITSVCVTQTPKSCNTIPSMISTPYIIEVEFINLVPSIGATSVQSCIKRMIISPLLYKDLDYWWLVESHFSGWFCLFAPKVWTGDGVVTFSRSVSAAECLFTLMRAEDPETLLSNYGDPQIFLPVTSLIMARFSNHWHSNIRVEQELILQTMAVRGL